eukprot:1157843-Pelagomonas_calceolata.AAC.15
MHELRPSLPRILKDLQALQDQLCPQMALVLTAGCLADLAHCKASAGCVSACFNIGVRTTRVSFSTPHAPCMYVSKRTF